MEEKAKGKTSTAIRKLMGFQPRTARVVKDGREEDILIAELQVGDKVSVRPGGANSGGWSHCRRKLFYR